MFLVSMALQIATTGDQQTKQLSNNGSIRLHYTQDMKHNQSKRLNDDV